MNNNFKNGDLNSLIACSHELYGDKYTFDEDLIPMSSFRTDIYCHEHGKFVRVLSEFLDGKECPHCMKNRPSVNELRNQDAAAAFIDKANEVHGNKYDYSKTVYVKSKEKVCITCSEHGDFWQTPSHHLSGKGCPLCGGTKKRTLQSFIEDARKVHDDKYDYSKTVYINNQTKVTIVCPEHGEFDMTPHNHLKGQGCPKCGNKKIWETRRRNAETK